ncbi:MAG: hypothetical protein ACLFUU_09675 [Desulfobacteraceae bacterium]
MGIKLLKKLNLLRLGGFMLLWLLGLGVSQGLAADPQVLRLGLSRVQNTTLLTVILTQAVEAQVSAVTAVSSPQLVIIFPEAVAAHLPSDLPGDQALVRQVRTLFTPGEKGVRVILDLIPDRPYIFWRQLRPAPSGMVQFIIALNPESQKETSQTPGLNLTRRPPPSASTAPKAKKSAPVEDYGYKIDPGRLESEEFRELGRLAPGAVRVFHFLEQQGWKVDRQSTADQPGQRLIQKFVLTNSRYPILTVRFTHIAGSSAASPDINFITLATENLTGSDAQRYREMCQWSTNMIKKHFEDIGDYYSDGLKPLRIVLRQQSQAEVLRNYDIFKQFLAAACPDSPQLSEELLARAKDKVNKRLEGVQYTLAENPLVILNMVDFLFLRVYFLGKVS